MGRLGEPVEFTLFRARFLTAAKRVIDRTELEESDMVLKQLDQYWRREVSNEESKRMRNKFWVRLQNSGWPREILLEAL